MNKRVFLSIIFISVIVFGIIAISGCVDPKDNPMLPTYNNFPRLGVLSINPEIVSSYATALISVKAIDDDGDPVKITFREGENRGAFQVISSTMAIWTAPITVDEYNIFAKVTDSNGASVEGYKTLRVVNSAPIIDDVTNATNYGVNPKQISWASGNTSTITVTCYDMDLPDAEVDITCEVDRVYDFLAGVDVDTVVYTISTLGTSTNNTTTVTTFLFTVTDRGAADFYNIYFDIDATDNIGNVTVNSPAYRIDTRP